MGRTIYTPIFTLEANGGRSFESGPDGTLETGGLFGMTKDLGSGFEFALNTGGNATLSTSRSEETIRDFEVTPVHVRLGWKWNTINNDFAVFSPLVEFAHKMQFYPSEANDNIAHPAVFMFGGGVEWFSQGPIAVFSKVEGTTVNEPVVFLSGIRFYVPGLDYGE